MAGEKGDSPGCWAESRQGGALTTGILTGLVKVGIISIHQTRCVLCALLGLSQPLGDPLLLSYRFQLQASFPESPQHSISD